MTEAPKKIGEEEILEGKAFIGWPILFFGTFLFGALSLVGIVQALLGNFWKMPIVGDIAEKVSF